MVRRVLAWLPPFWESRVSTLGVVLTTVAGCTLVLAFAMGFVGGGINVYTTAFALLVLPVLFMTGLILIPIGLRRVRKKRADPRKTREALADFLKSPRAARTMLFVGIATLVNILILGAAGSEAIGWMDSPEFCGTTCHTVMEPEYTAYLRSPHSRVGCVECHIGPGASWAVKSKLDGLRQVWHTILGDYDRPVHAPVHSLRPSRDTCEKCHWPAKFHGNRVAHWVHFQDDEPNSPEVNAVILRIGGENALTGRYEGIHWHVSPNTEVRYEALDAKRERIGRVWVVRDGETVKEYLPPDEDPGPVIETRLMDCVDCHNRPTHTMDGSAGQALDLAFAHGRLDRKIPFLKRIALPLLDRVDRPRDRNALAQTFGEELAAAYAAGQPEAPVTPEQLNGAAEGLADVYLRNIFPDMRIGWSTYPSHIGHRGDPPERTGCFRCHDDKHKTADGALLSQDCDLCHELVADEEALDDLEEGLKMLLFGR